MKALILKELREHLWMFLGALAVMLLGYARSQYALLPEQAWQNVSRRSFLMVTSIGGAGFMLALGFRQTFEEVRRGSWTFLLHRPIARQRIFLAKVLAALLMFVAAILAPTAAVAAWCAWPGNVAGPFVPSMLVPASVDLLCALPYYFAGCVVGLWQARWTGSRGLVLVLPVFNSLFTHVIAEHAWMSVLASLVALGWLAGLARALFLGPERRSHGKRALLATALGFGLCGLHLAAFAFVPTPIVDSTHRDYGVTERWFVSPEGEIRRAVERGSEVEAVFGVDGKPVAGELPSQVWLSDLSAEEASVSPSSPSIFAREKYRGRRRYQRLAQEEEGYAREWYFDHEAQCFVAYDRVTKLRAGTLGPDGFSAENGGRGFGGKPLDRLEMSRPLLAFTTGAYRVDWARASVQRIALVSRGPLQRLSHLTSDGHAETARVLLRSATHVDVVEAGAPARAIPLDAQLTQAELTVGRVEATNEYYVRYPHFAWERHGARAKRGGEGQTIVFYAKDGSETRRWSSPNSQPDDADVVAVNHPLRPALLAPPALTLLSVMQDRGPAWAKAQWTATHALIALLLGLASALISLLLSRLHSRRARLGLAALCVVGGPLVAILPLLLPRDGGVLCSSCGRPRAVGPQACEGCSAQLGGYAQSDSSILDDAFMPAAD